MYMRYSPQLTEYLAGNNHLMNVATKIEEEVAAQCYLECLAVECGEGQCAEAIRTAFDLKQYEGECQNNI